MQFRKLIRISIFFLNLIAINLLASYAGKCTSKSEDDMKKEKAIYLSSKDLHTLKMLI